MILRRGRRAVGTEVKHWLGRIGLLGSRSRIGWKLGGRPHVFLCSGGGNTVHVTSAKQQPIGADVGDALLDGLNNADRRTGAVVEDATQGGWGGTNEVGEHLLIHVLRLHDLSDSVFHIVVHNSK